MNNRSGFHIVFVIGLCALFALAPASVKADEMLALYGLKGYAYTYSPLVTDGLHLQTGAMYSIYHENNLTCRDGYIWVVPMSITYGDGDWWEAAAASQWESWKNTDFDVDETGFGDIFLGGKLRFLKQDKGMFLDMAVMPYLLFPTGSRDKSIGDLYLFNPSDDDDFSYGANLLLGHRWKRFYLSFNIGINYVDTDKDYIESTTMLYGLAAEYHISETLNGYMEFLNNENKNKFNYPANHFCYDGHI